MEGKPSCTGQRGWILGEFVYVISVVITPYSRGYHRGIHGIARGRKSLARARGRVWLGFYNFRSKLNPRFWGNVRRLIGLVGEGSLVQYSFFMTGSRRGAMVAERIARHYGASVMVFKGEEIEFAARIGKLNGVRNSITE